MENVMKEETRANLDLLFEKREQDEEEWTKKTSEAQVAREANFVARFVTLVDDMIAPTMYDFGTYLRNKGFHYQVIRQEEDRSGRRPEITFQVYEVQTTYHAKDTPHLKFYCDKRGEKIGIHESTIGGDHDGQAGDIGSLKVSDITADKVENYLADLLRKLLA